MRQTSIVKSIMVVIFCLAVGCIGGLFVSYYLSGGFQTPMAQGTQIEIKNGADIATVAQTYQDAVVSIKVAGSSRGATNTSLGSGVCVHSGGYIVTNYHVIYDAVKSSAYDVYVFLNEDTTNGHKSEILWANNALDLAIIKSSYTNIKYAKMKDRTFACGEQEKIKIGEEVISIGTPIEMTLQNTTTFGRVNGTGRVGAADNRIYEYMIQHQATINSGNSGGPLIDSNGYVVGINSCAMVKDNNGDHVAEINYAVPIYPVVAILNDVVSAYESKQKYVEPILAITIQDKIYKNYNLGSFTEDGVMISSNPTNEMFQKGLTKGSVILSLSYNGDKYTISCTYDFYYNCLRAGKGTMVKLEISEMLSNSFVEVTLP